MRLTRQCPQCLRQIPSAADCTDQSRVAAANVARWLLHGGFVQFRGFPKYRDSIFCLVLCTVWPSSPRMTLTSLLCGYLMKAATPQPTLSVRAFAGNLAVVAVGFSPRQAALRRRIVILKWYRRVCGSRVCALGWELRDGSG